MTTNAYLAPRRVENEKLKRYLVQHLPAETIGLGVIGGGFLLIMAFILFAGALSVDEPANVEPFTLLDAAAASLGVSTFCGAGILMLFGAMWSWRHASESGQLQSHHPNQPWRWRKDWNQGLIIDHGTFTVGFYVFVSIIACGISWTAEVATSGPLLFMAVPEKVGLNLVTATFCLVATSVFTYWLYRYFCERRCGPARLQLITLPAQPGTPLVGVVSLSTPFDMASKVTIQLQSSKKVTGAPDAPDPTEILTEADYIYEASADGNRSEIPVVCDVPSVARPSCDDATQWKLSVTFCCGGRIYNRIFDVPVFELQAADGEKRCCLTAADRSLFDSVLARKSQIRSRTFTETIHHCGGEVEADTDRSLMFWLPFDFKQLFMQVVLCPVGIVLFGGAMMLFGDRFGFAGTTMLTCVFVGACLTAYPIYRTIRFRQRIEVDSDTLSFNRMGFWRERNFSLRLSEIDRVLATNSFKRHQPGIGVDQTVAVRTAQGKDVTILSGLAGRAVAIEIQRKIARIVVI